MRNKDIIYLCIILAILTSFLGLWIPVMNVDAAQYASMSREMAETGSYLQVYNRGGDYLDKPPLLFWLSAALMQVFGASTLWYKLPSFLFSVFAGYGIFRIATLNRNVEAGMYAALIWFTSQAWFLMTLDVRTDLLLTSCIALSVWQFEEWFASGKYKHTLFAGIFVGCAMLAKGPLGLVLPMVVVFVSALSKGKLKSLLHPVNWAWVLVTALMLVPMCIGLWQQFESEGLYFFFWKQSFGRITGENEWQNGAGPFFLTQNLLWAVLPWTYVLLLALWHIVRAALQKVSTIHGYGFMLAGIFFPLVSLSASRYQLPHYIFVALPYVAILCGVWLQSVLAASERKTIQHIRWASKILVVLALPLVVLLELYVMSTNNLVFRILWLSLMIYGFYRIYSIRAGFVYMYGFAVGLWICVNLYLNVSFYPALLQYQPAIAVAATLDAAPAHRDGFYVYQTGASHALDFYTGRTNLILYNPADISDYKAKHLLTDAAGLQDLAAAGISVRVQHAYSNYPVQFLSLPFLNPTTRSAHIPYLYWVEVQAVAGS